MTKLLLCFLLVFPQPLAMRPPDCVCVKDPHSSVEKIKADRRKTYDLAGAIFEGKVVALDAYTVRLRLMKLWKGTSPDEIVLSTGAVPGVDGTPLPEECSYDFRLGEEYLVYAYDVDGKLKTDVCSTLQLLDATDEEKGLDEIKPHETIKENSNE